MIGRAKGQGLAAVPVRGRGDGGNAPGDAHIDIGVTGNRVDQVGIGGLHIGKGRIQVDGVAGKILGQILIGDRSLDARRIVDLIDGNGDRIGISGAIAVRANHRQGVSPNIIQIPLVDERAKGGIDVRLAAREGQVVRAIGPGTNCRSTREGQIEGAIGDRQLHCREIAINIIYRDAADRQWRIFKNDLRPRHRVHRCSISRCCRNDVLCELGCLYLSVSCIEPRDDGANGAAPRHGFGKSRRERCIAKPICPHIINTDQGLPLAIT